MSRAFRLTILVDNQAGEGLVAEHGLSFWLQVDGRSVLFDTGQGPALEANVADLGIDLARTTDIVLSHGHYDHTGGLPFALQKAPQARLHCHPAVTVSRYSIRDGTARSIRMPASSRDSLDRQGAEHRFGVEGPTRFSEHAGLTGPIPRLTDFETTGGPFFLDPEGRQPDPIIDDQALWVKTPSGVVVVVGCCHSGLINTLHAVGEQTGGEKIRAVIGGFHLGNADDQTLAKTVAALQTVAPAQLIPCHCTGERGLAAMQTAFGPAVTPGECGRAFRWES